MDGYVDGWMDGQRNGWMDMWMDGQRNGWMDGWTEEWMEGQNGWINRGMEFLNPMSLS